MTFAEASGIVDRVSHPFMLFVLEMEPMHSANEIATLRVAHKVVDSETGRMIILWRTQRIVIDYMNEYNLISFLIKSTHEAHIHEADEFFKFNGVAINHPHKESEWKQQLPK